MKTETDVVVHHGNLNNDRIRFQFDENSVAHLQSVMIGMYSDPTMAVIREYSTNAADSHAAAGIKDPIEVFLPTLYDKVFKVVDHGIGMSVETITEQFSRYGWSSKRDTDDQSGMLGLGCKCGLAYTSQFTVLSRHDGVQCMVLVTREGDGGASLEIVEKEQTDLPNGVEVLIPVSGSIDHFNRKALEFFEYWDTGTVILDGEPVISIFDPAYEDAEIIRIDDDVILHPGRTLRDKIVMAGVPYPMPRPACLSTGDVGVIARVPIGCVKPAPSREALNLESMLTKGTLEELNSFLQTALQKTLLKSVHDAPDANAAYDRAQVVRRLLGSGVKIDWKGIEVPIPHHSVGFQTLKINQASSWGGRDHASKQKNARIESLREADMLVMGYYNPSLPASYKEKARRYFLEQNPNRSIRGFTIYFCAQEAIYLDPWIDAAKMVPIETIKAVVMPGHVKAERNRVLRYRCYGNGIPERETSLTDLKTDNVVCWIDAETYKNSSGYEQRWLDDGETILIVRQRDLGNIPVSLPSFVQFCSMRLRLKKSRMTPQCAWHLLHRATRDWWDTNLMGNLLDGHKRGHTVQDAELLWACRLISETEFGDKVPDLQWWRNRARHERPDDDELYRLAAPYIRRLAAVKRKYPMLDAERQRRHHQVEIVNLIHAEHDRKRRLPVLARPNLPVLWAPPIFQGVTS